VFPGLRALFVCECTFSGGKDSFNYVNATSWSSRSEFGQDNGPTRNTEGLLLN